MLKQGNRFVSLSLLSTNYKILINYMNEKGIPIKIKPNLNPILNVNQLPPFI